MAMNGRAETLVLLAGIILLVIAAAAYDWRLGAAFAGLILIASIFDLRVPRR